MGDFGIGNEVPDTTGILDIGIKSQYQASLVLITFYALHRNGVFFFLIIQSNMRVSTGFKVSSHVRSVDI